MKYICLTPVSYGWQDGPGIANGWSSLFHEFQSLVLVFGFHMLLQCTFRTKALLTLQTWHLLVPAVSTSEDSTAFNRILLSRHDATTAMIFLHFPPTAVVSQGGFSDCKHIFDKFRSHVCLSVMMFRWQTSTWAIGEYLAKTEKLSECKWLVKNYTITV